VKLWVDVLKKSISLREIFRLTMIL